MSNAGRMADIGYDFNSLRLHNADVQQVLIKGGPGLHSVMTRSSEVWLAWRWRIGMEVASNIERI